MKEIVVISGKGGTGKTSIAASFASLGTKDLILADCDVDASDMHLLMKPDFKDSEDYYSGEKAIINQADCSQCGRCADICRFDAISIENGEYKVDLLQCEGCGYCARVCPDNAITNEIQNAGQWYVSNIKTGSIMVHARLGIGADNSGKLVAKVKNEAREIATDLKKDVIVIDGPPGIGCPVISSLAGADFAVLVTEPTVAGLHDLKRIYDLLKHFKIRAACIINKADLNIRTTRQITDFLNAENIMHLANLPYDESFTESMIEGKTIIEYTDNDLTRTITDSWNKIIQVL